jgi:oligo-1,6-glucosidase
VDPDHPKIFAYLRDLENDRFLIVMNFSGDEVVYRLPEGLNTKSMVFTNGTELRENEDSLRMAPWDARIYRLAK